MEFDATLGQWTFWNRGKHLIADRTVSADDLRLPIFRHSADAGWTYEQIATPSVFGDSHGVGSQLAYELHERAVLPSSEQALRKWLLDLNRNHQVGYRLKGNVLLTPWSIDVGPIGLKPERDVLPFGHWVSESNPAVQVVLPVAPVARSARPFDFIGISLEQQLASHEWTPDRWGISAQGAFCPHSAMNHSDSPIWVLWIPLGKDRAVRFTSTAFSCCFQTHNRVGDLEFFRRHAP